MNFFNLQNNFPLRGKADIMLVWSMTILARVSIVNHFSDIMSVLSTTILARVSIVNNFADIMSVLSTTILARVSIGKGTHQIIRRFQRKER